MTSDNSASTPRTTASAQSSPRDVTAVQHAMLVTSLSAPEEGSYLQQKLLDFDEVLCAGTLRDALAALTDRHPMLRTSFDMSSPSHPVQRTGPAGDFRPTLQEHDWRWCDRKEADRRLAALLREDRRRGFDFPAGPPTRFHLVHRDEPSSTLLWTSHHALLDGRSYAPLLAELMELYAACAGGAEAGAAVSRAPFTAYVDWAERRDTRGEAAAWSRALAPVRGATPLGPRTGRDEGAEPVFRTVTVSLPKTFAVACDRTRMPLNDLVHAAWALLLHRLSAERDVVLGSTRTCRAFHPDGRDMVGPLINTVPLRSTIGEHTTVRGLVRVLRTRARQMRPWVHTPLPRIRAAIDWPADQPLFETVVMYDDDTAGSRLRSLGGPWAERSFRLVEQAGFPLALCVRRHGDLSLALTHDRRRWSDESADEFLDQVVSNLLSMAARPGARVRDLPRRAGHVRSAATVRVPTAVRRLVAAADDGPLVLCGLVVAFLLGQEGHQDTVGCVLRAADDPEGTEHEVTLDLSDIPAGTTAGGLHRLVRRALGTDLPALVGAAGHGLVLESAAGTFRITADASGIRCRTSDDGRPDEGTSRRLARFLRSVRSPATDVTRIPLVTASERIRLLEQGRGTADGPPPDTCVTALVSAQARRRPHAPAVRTGGVTWTYGELEERTSRLAGVLTTRGVGPGELVGVCLDRSPDLVAVLLAVLRTGAGYVPLDPDHPPARLAGIVADTRMRLLVSRSGLLRDGCPGEVPVLELDTEADRIAAQTATDVPDRAAPDATAYVLHTSGSTGRPKGVEVGHGALANLLHSMAEVPGCTERDHMLSVTTVCFDIAALEIFLPLTRGGTVTIATAAETRDGFLLKARLEAEHPSLMQATPATWRTLIHAGWTGHPDLTVLCGGEQLHQDLARELCARAGRVWNVYGPTETTIWSSIAPVRPGTPVHIGRPIGRTRFHVVDRWDRLVPPGTAGELLIGGAGVAKGYLGRPDLTRTRFVPDPIDPAGGRVFRTGDLVSRAADGNLFHLGRTDGQVKVRGFRVELGEVETALREHPAVSDAAVSAHTSDHDGHLMAHLVLADADAGSGAVAVAVALGALAKELRAHLSARLPAYMVPSHYVPVPALPLTSNGKLDRKALTPPPARGPRPAEPAETAHHASARDVERVISAIWCEVLDLDTVPPDDGFFDLGGTSLQLMLVTRRLRDSLAPSLRHTDVLRHSTVRSLADHVRGERSGQGRVRPVRGLHASRTALAAGRRR
ncbi:amino acid adenylation domain-containing protein [Streptomyces sp. NPDC059761]|uniref:non-ribosomal peptide synthetase n=1 Tax=Streptomyces sp. NPDC059761 TaxID=3346937 RepID=UPI0036651851